MSDATVLVSGSLAAMSMIGIVGLLYDRVHRSPPPPCDWSDAEHQHAVIMSRYYREFGPSD